MSQLNASRSATRVFANGALAIALSAVFAAPLFAQNVKVSEEKPGLLKKAKITVEAATATALGKAPGGKVEKAEIENEDGKLIYSFDIKVAGKAGITEVGVDAMTGAVVNVEHEDAAAEAKEAKADKAKDAKGKPKVKKP